MMLAACLALDASGARAGAVTEGSGNNVFLVAPSSGDLAVPANAAIASCPSAGCTVEIAPPTSAATLSGPIIINKSNVTLKCDSPYSMAGTRGFKTSRSPNGYFYGVVDIGAVNNINVLGCRLDVSAITAPVAAIHVWGSTNVKIDGNYITSTVSGSTDSGILGIRVEGSSTQPSGKIEISHNYVTVPWIAYTVGYYGYDVDIHDNFSYQSGQCFDFNGVSVMGKPPIAGRINFHSNNCTSSYNSGYVESIVDVIIAHNMFYLDSSEGPTIRVHINGSTFQVRTLIDSNDFVGSSAQSNAIHMYQIAQQWQISNNIISGYGNDGILIDAEAATLMYGSITGNQILNVGTSGATYCGINLLANPGHYIYWLAITNNSFIDVQKPQTEKYPVCATGNGAPPILNLLYTANMSNLGNPISLPNGCKSCSLYGSIDLAGPTLSTFGELGTTQTPTASKTPSDHSIPIVVNGTTYYMRLSTTP